MDIWGDLSAGVTHIVMHVRRSCYLLLRCSLRAKLRARDAAAAAKCHLRQHAVNRLTGNASLGGRLPAPVVSMVLPGWPRFEIARRGVYSAL